MLVAGTGRCGTVYMAKLLTALGLPCGHESVFSYHSLKKCIRRLHKPACRKMSFCSTHDARDRRLLPKWVDPAKAVAESSYMMVPHLDHPDLAGVPLVHVVRSPLRVVSSFVHSLNYFRGTIPDRHPGRYQWERLIYATLPEIASIPTQVERACYFYTAWNRLVERQAGARPYLRCRVEEVASDPAFYEFVGRTPLPGTAPPGDTNSFGAYDGRVAFGDVPPGDTRDSIVEMSERYGYRE